MGIHAKTGDFAVLTNVYEPLAVPATDNLTSRGKLVEMFINGHYDTLDDSAPVLPNWNDFMGFNLLFGNVKNFKHSETTDETHPSVHFISNRASAPQGKPEEPTPVSLRNGFHCVSNSFLNDKEWPKVRYLKDELEKIVTSPANENATAQQLCDQLAQILTARPLFPAEQVEQYLIDDTIKFCNSHGNNIVSQNSGVTLDLDEMVAEVMDSCQNIFVDYSQYKTKSQTIILVHQSGKVHYFHRNTDDVEVPVPILPFSEQMKESNVANVGWSEFVLQY
jgi:uncharacterized protein with NRDE domain